MGKTSDPKFVRLAPYLSHGMLRDFEGSRFGISGNDVKSFPGDDNPLAQKWVRHQITQGKIVPASQAEYEEARDGDEPLPEGELPHQEHKVLGFLGIDPEHVADAAEISGDDETETVDEDDDDETEDEGESEQEEPKAKAEKSGKPEKSTAKKAAAKPKSGKGKSKK